MIEFSIHVQQGHRRYLAWVVGDRENTEVSAPTRGDAIVKLAETHVDDSEVPGPLENMGGR